LGVLDFGFQRWQYGRDLMMTVQEAKEEMKQLEGDPRIKQRIRQIQRQMAMKRMMAEVPEADVIITNPIRFAVALRYDPKTMDAPVVIAKGARLLAQRIREIAEEHDVPIVEKPELARALFKSIDVGQPVPEDLFRAVAEVLAFVFKIDRREEKRHERSAMSGAPAYG
jgi:flagellar biosynthetic protein FlhB